MKSKLKVVGASMCTNLFVVSSLLQAIGTMELDCGLNRGNQSKAALHLRSLLPLIPGYFMGRQNVNFAKFFVISGTNIQLLLWCKQSN